MHVLPGLDWCPFQGVFMPCTQNFHDRIWINPDYDQDKAITKDEKMSQKTYSIIPPAAQRRFAIKWVAVFRLQLTTKE